MDQLVDLLTKYGVFFGIPPLFLIIMAWISWPVAKRRHQADGHLPFYGDK